MTTSTSIWLMFIVWTFLGALWTFYSIPRLIIFALSCPKQCKLFFQTTFCAALALLVSWGLFFMAIFFTLSCLNSSNTWIDRRQYVRTSFSAEDPPVLRRLLQHFFTFWCLEIPQAALLGIRCQLGFLLLVCWLCLLPPAAVYPSS